MKCRLPTLLLTRPGVPWRWPTRLRSPSRTPPRLMTRYAGCRTCGCSSSSIGACSSCGGCLGTQLQAFLRLCFMHQARGQALCTSIAAAFSSIDTGQCAAADPIVGTCNTSMAPIAQAACLWLTPSRPAVLTITISTALKVPLHALVIFSRGYSFQPRPGPGHLAHGSPQPLQADDPVLCCSCWMRPSRSGA